jgi:pimeloyl-ACP methyl ester carboxylesterase
VNAPFLTQFDTINGSLGVHRWINDHPIVVALAGVDGSGLGWEAIATEAAVPVTALDLRGRGAASVAGPFGVAAHAVDVAEYLRSLPAPVVLAGHSFGGHVACRVAADHPELVQHLVLVDGGPARLIPEGMTAAGLAHLALGNIIPNLASKPFPVSEEAVRTDFLSMVADAASTEALAAVRIPVSLIRAEHGMAEGMPPVITDAVIDNLHSSGVDLTVSSFAGATHFSLLFNPTHSALVARHLADCV